MDDQRWTGTQEEAEARAAAENARPVSPHSMAHYRYTAKPGSETVGPMLWTESGEHNLDDFIEDLEQFMMDADPTLVRHLHEGWERHQKRMYKTLDANDPKVFMLRFLDTLRQTVEENERTNTEREIENG